MRLPVVFKHGVISRLLDMGLPIVFDKCQTLFGGYGVAEGLKQDVGRCWLGMVLPRALKLDVRSCMLDVGL
jgi:hypothetical protein